MTQQKDVVKKGWGEEHIWVTNGRYTSKFLHFVKGGRSSMHFHAFKYESWFVLAGSFEIEWLDLRTTARWKTVHGMGSVVEVKSMTPHQITCLEPGIILEVSTPDSVEDNYRIEPGDSQKKE